MVEQQIVKGETVTEVLEGKQLNFLERWKLTRKLDTMQKELAKVMKEDVADRVEQKKKLKVIILDLMSNEGLHIEDDICLCGVEDCPQREDDGEHKKFHVDEAKEADIDTWSVEKCQKVIIDFFTELKIYIKENKKNRG